MSGVWLVTGGAGFIGGNFVRLALREAGVRMVVLDALTYAGDLGRIDDLLDGSRVEFVRGDIRDPGLVRELFARHEVSKVIHFAAETHVDRSIDGPRDFISTNIEGTVNLLEAARAAWRDDGDKVFLHVSTDEVFGALGLDDAPFDEGSPYRPNSPYAATKAAADHIVRAWRNTYGLPAIVTNCSNNYGAWQHPEKLVPLIILNAWEGRELPIYGDGLQVRDWLHVEDHCEALLAVATRGRPGETYVIGGAAERSNLDIVHAICDCVDRLKGDGTASRALIRHVADRPGHDRRYAINFAKIARELGWRPRHAPEAALPEVVRWYVGNKGWVDRVRSGEYQEYYQNRYGAPLQV
ncbi:dTDP-glucose 4,6-dehydratase [Anaeroselena agilis]|uniref:dTDP-glucose 4,6-dehydratase n=1 Tax=Anaeroselena agilis TaxID=3063788 RepID=A0ABU3NSE4_9FIRM|nr:dTDP-glucose 4,6-dehydratase [Selenomonadales bacterium 4137-cl]